MASIRLRFTFPQNLITRPVIYDLSTKFNLVTNIRRADVRDDQGWVVLQIDGEQEEIDKGITWVAELGVRVDPVAGDVIEG